MKWNLILKIPSCKIIFHIMYEFRPLKNNMINFEQTNFDRVVQNWIRIIEFGLIYLIQ